MASEILTENQLRDCHGSIGVGPEICHSEGRTDERNQRIICLLYTYKVREREK